MCIIIEKCPISSNIAQYCPILPNVVLYHSILFKWLSKLTLIRVMIYCKEHSDIVHYCQIYPNIVRHWPILSSCTLFRHFPLKTKPQPIEVFWTLFFWTCFLMFSIFLYWTSYYLQKLVISCKNLFLSLVVVRLVIF